MRRHVESVLIVHRRAFLLACLAIAPCWTTAQAGEPPLKVLFIGNSYTYVNDLPSLIISLADAGGRKMEVGQHLVGGRTLEQHVRDKQAIEKIRERNWDIVVLQEHSLQPILNRDSMAKYAGILNEEIKKHGAKTVLYLTWARQDIPQMQEGASISTSPDYARAIYKTSGLDGKIDFAQWRQQHASGLAGGLNGAYFDIAKQLNADVAPVGMAWRTALAKNPALVLYQADESHPAAEGSYLAACVFYASLLGKSPVGLPGELKKDGKILVRIARDEGKLLQEIAWQTIQEAKQRQGEDRKTTRASGK